MFLSQRKDNTARDYSFMSRPYTDILRAIAILLIIIHHASLDAGERVFTPLGGIGVAIFLILSGYGITVSYMKSGLAHYWRKKVARIWLPYVLLLLTVTLLKGNYSRMLSPEFILDLLCLRTSYWFISFLVYNYILFYISHRIDALRKYKYVPFVVFAVVTFFVCGGVEAEQCFSFVTGVWIAYNMETAKKMLLNWHTFTALLLTSVVFLGFKQVPQVRGAIECSHVLATSVDILIKYTFALFTISIFTPPIHRILIINDLSLQQETSWQAAHYLRSARRRRWSCILCTSAYGSSSTKTGRLSAS